MIHWVPNTFGDVLKTLIQLRHNCSELGGSPEIRTAKVKMLHISCQKLNFRVRKIFPQNRNFCVSVFLLLDLQMTYRNTFGQLISSCSLLISTHANLCKSRILKTMQFEKQFFMELLLSCKWCASAGMSRWCEPGCG